MHSCDVLIVGGGPAGSSCAWALRDSGLDVVVIDRAQFPRDKTCAGWVTPPVWHMLQIDRDQYATTRTLQPITGFRTGLLGRGAVETHYREVVSYGIRRCEFDHYLLQRCGARLLTGTPVHSIKRDGDHWIVNGELAARVLVGAGGNFCPVTRHLNLSAPKAPLVAAQEIEFEVSPQLLEDGHVDKLVPELFFCDDLNGYGWCFRKGNFLNIGLGHVEPERMKADLAQLCKQLQQHGKVSCTIPTRMHGHAYRLFCSNGHRVVTEGALLIGDAAGLADPHSGEGIRPAVESGLAAGRTLLEASHDYRIEHLLPYDKWVQQRYHGPSATSPSGKLATRLRNVAGRALMRSHWFARHVLLDRWFLHRIERTEDSQAMPSGTH